MGNNSLSIGDPFLSGDRNFDLMESILWHEVKIAAKSLVIAQKHNLRFALVSNSTRLNQACRTIARLCNDVPPQDPSDIHGEEIQAWIVDRMMDLAGKATEWARKNTLDHTEQAPF